MGFLASQYLLAIPTLLVHVALVVSCLRSISSFALTWLGLSDTDVSEQFASTKSPLISADAIREWLPVCTYGEYLERYGWATDSLESADCDDEEEETCAVCLSKFQEEEEIRETCNCRHIFHKGCLDKWLDHRHVTCPLCRCSLVKSNVTEVVDGNNCSTHHSWALDTLSYVFANDLPLYPC